MGTWGFELYQNDTSLDVKDEFEELYNAGKTAADITDKLINDYKSITGNIDEEPIFWFALADTQWNLGVLLPVVKEKALYWICKVNDMFNCQAINMPEKAKIKKTLDGLRAKLLSPQPPIKKAVKKGYTDVNGVSEMSLLINWKATWRKKKAFMADIF